MVFEETGYLDLTNIPTTFIYFLLQDKEVVYIGQTRRGLARVYNHIRNKQFNKIYVIECDSYELDYLENIYILKYNPIYNKAPNMKEFYSMDKTVHTLNKMYSRYSKGVFDYKFKKSKVKKMLDVLKINPIIYNEKKYITSEEFYKITDCIDDYMKGAPLDEIFNIGIQSKEGN